MTVFRVSVPAMDPIPDDRGKLLALIGMRLRRARENRDPETGRKRGLSRAEAAKAIGASPTSIQSWEEGTAAASVDMVVRAARAYGVTPDFLLGFDPRVEGKALVDLRMVREVENAIESGDAEAARRLLNDDPPLIVLGIVIPAGAELQPATEAERAIRDLHRRFADAFPDLAQEWAERHGRPK